MAVLSLNSVPIGFRFRPTDEELIDFYLRSKINGNRDDELGVIREIDVCKCEPWDLPHLSAIRTRDPEWFFFCPLDRKYPKGNRLNRATEAGYWKATGKDRKIKSGSSLIGMKKTLVFYSGRAPRGKRTNWVMHEYRTTLDELDGTKPGQNAFVICRLFKKQDETTEDINGEEVDPDVSSPTEDLQAELEGPQDSLAAEEEAEKIPNSSETYPAGLHDEVICNAVAPILECDNNDYEAYGVIGEVLEIAPAEVDPLVDALNPVYNPMVGPLDCKLFSPLHAQIEAEQAPWMFDHVGDSDDSGSQKNSTIESETPKAMAFGKDGGSCSESDAEVAQVLLGTETANKGASLEIKATAQDCTIPICKQDVNFSGTGAFYNVLNSNEELSNHVNTTCNVDRAITGIRIRSRSARSQTDTENFVTQGNAPRRLRLQCKLQVLSLYQGNATNNWSSEEKEDSKPVVTKEVKVMEEDITIGGDAACGTMDELQEISLSESSKNNISRSKSIISVGEEVPARWKKKFSARRSHKPFSIIFWVAVTLILFIVLVSTSNAFLI
ncbi:NAC domain-containing protein 91-like isoform X2 [Durio zibethinus]|uniref:NAC domain-containing protein 91-like isoform X2 n=1 Tax=Durio zibethinus TaxID=66656 RepID=A0A6P5X4T6_DURZI|nr:NAC domain-containing protein 91-like isoform X2 [Durio zibethinus]